MSQKLRNLKIVTKTFRNNSLADYTQCLRSKSKCPKLRHLKRVFKTNKKLTFIAQKLRKIYAQKFGNASPKVRNFQNVENLIDHFAALSLRNTTTNLTLPKNIQGVPFEFRDVCRFDSNDVSFLKYLRNFFTELRTFLGYRVGLGRNN